MRTLTLTAATLRAMLCYVDSGVTRAIAYDRDDMAKPLAEKIRGAVGEAGGSQLVTIAFDDSEHDLERRPR